jgi:hypothetical protein
VGTCIDCFFAHDTHWEPAALERQLNELCTSLATEVEAVRTRGQFSRGGRDGTWYVMREATEPADPRYLTGEGSAGLSIDVYRRVVCLGSIERFGALYDAAFGIAIPLRKLICSLANSLSHPSAIAVAAAGMGDTDRATDVAYYDGGSFDDVCRELRHAAGDPTDDWDRLGDAGWYLGPPIAQRGGPSAG